VPEGGVECRVREGSKSPLPQLEPSIHGHSSHFEGEGEGELRIKN